MLKIEQQADLSAKRESLKKLSLLCHSISGLPNVYTIFIYRKRTPFSEKRPYYLLGYGLRKLCGTTIPFVLRVYDYIPLMSPVTRGKKRILKARFAGNFDFFDKLNGAVVFTAPLLFYFFFIPTTDLRISAQSSAFTRPSLLKSHVSSSSSERRASAWSITEASFASTFVLLSASPGSLV